VVWYKGVVNMALFHRRADEFAENEEEFYESEAVDNDEAEDDYEETGDFVEYSSESNESNLIDYDVYVMSKRERIFYILAAACVIFVVGMIFYQNPILSLILAVASLYFPKIRTKQIISKRKRALNLQFKDLLYALSSSMSAGRSLEIAFKDALRDLEVLYPDENTPIMQETVYIVRCISMNMTVEDAISQFARRAHIEDIENFADVIRICKRSGGNLIEVIRSTSQMISDKIETKNEIETIITAKKFESRILTCTPIVMVAMLSVTSPDYMEPVFNTFIGAVVMTIAIIMFAIAFFISEKIMDIEV
jgi:tight adherence protein B